MNPPMKKSLYWTPRILLAAFALFIVIFSFDVFDETHGFWNIALALFMHNLPTLFLFLFLYVTWRREWIGAIIFPVLGILYIVWGWHRFVLSVYFIIAGPMFLLGILYLLNWIYRGQLRPTPPTPPEPPVVQLSQGNI